MCSCNQLENMKDLGRNQLENMKDLDRNQQENIGNQQTARPPGCKCGRAGTHANATRECLAVVPNPTRTLPSRGRPSPSRSATLRKSGRLAIKFPAGAS